MDKKRYIFAILIVIVIAGAIAGRKYIAPKSCPDAEGKTVVINMRSLKNQWRWDPNPIEVECGDTITLNIYNEDEYDHGFALDAYGINKRLPPLTTTTIVFRVTKKGTFVFYCSVPCGPGHFDQKGILMVR
jgi:cytochrome c oxidase subunit 2